MFNGLEIAANGMNASKQWVEVSSNNLSNIDTTRTEEGGPYQRQTVSMEAREGYDAAWDDIVGKGSEVSEIMRDEETKMVYDPDHPDAMEDGYVEMPHINLAAEMTNLMAGQQNYDTNVSVLNTQREMMDKDLEIGSY